MKFEKVLESKIVNKDDVDISNLVKVNLDEKEINGRGTISLVFNEDGLKVLIGGAIDLIDILKGMDILNKGVADFVEENLSSLLMQGILNTNFDKNEDFDKDFNMDDFDEFMDDLKGNLDKL